MAAALHHERKFSASYLPCYHQLAIICYLYTTCLEGRRTLPGGRQRYFGIFLWKVLKINFTYERANKAYSVLI
jgi:hypothetical protein